MLYNTWNPFKVKLFLIRQVRMTTLRLPLEYFTV